MTVISNTNDCEQPKIDLRPMNDAELLLYAKATRRLRGKIGKQIRAEQDSRKKNNKVKKD